MRKSGVAIPAAMDPDLDTVALSIPPRLEPHVAFVEKHAGARVTRFTAKRIYFCSVRLGA
jgi:hypothetical protein